MVEGVVSRAFIMTNNHTTCQSTINASRSKVVLLQKSEKIVETKYKSAIEQSQLPPTGTQFYQYTLNESATVITETSLTRLKKASRTINEPAKTITEALIHKGAHTITEPSISITEGLTKVRKAQRIINEPATSVGESIQKAVKRSKTITEGATAITEGLTAHKKTFKTLTPESTTISEVSLVKVAKKVRQLIETPTEITEGLKHLRSVTFSEDPIAITEALAANRIFVRTMAEFSFQPSSFTSASFLYTLPITESLTKNAMHRLAESTAITESLLAVKRMVRTLSETVTLGAETVRKLVNHILTENVAITEALSLTRRPSKILTDDPIDITESLTSARFYYRVINPESFTSTSFTTGAFESFESISEDAVVITEELEAVVLPYWQKVINEPSVEITESLVALKIPALVVTPPGGGNRRRRRTYPPLFQRRQVLEKPLEVVREPILYQFELTEPATQITESLASTKIITRVETKIQTVSVAAAVPSPQIIEKIVYVDRIVEKEVQPPPIIRAQDIIVSKPRPVEIEQEILVSTQAYSDKRKSKAASAKLEVLRQLVTLLELEELI